MGKYRKKPVEIEAVIWAGGNFDELKTLGLSSLRTIDSKLVIPTLEGEMLASLGDYIIKGVKGEFYPCKPDIFEMSYENAE